MKTLKSGYIAIVGRPNVGKSTLINRIIGEKISIVSRKAQTTRHRIMGILTRPDAQFVFVDTPGFQTQHANALNRAMNRGVTQALADVDVVILVVDAGRFDARDRTVLKLLPADRPVVLAVNKCDQLKDKNALLPLLAELAKEHDFAAIVPISAARGNQVDGAHPAGTARLCAVLLPRIPQLLCLLTKPLADEGALPHAGGVGLHHTHDLVDPRRRKAGAHRRIGRNGV